LATTNQQINSVRLGDSLRAEFAALLMSSRNFQDQVGAESSSTTMPILNKSKFSALKIPLPNVDCTHLLGPVRQYLDGISIMQQNVDAASRRTAMLRHSLLHAAFSGRLTGRSSDLDLAEELAAQ
jgi:type I restriction enzyme S subunit